MSQQAPQPESAKLAPAWRRRLSRMPAGRMVRAVVLIETGPAEGGRTRDRAQAIRAVREAAALAKRELDPILARLGGRWLSEEPDALGSIGVEAPAEAILALAESERVRAVLEDQRISGLRAPRR